MVPDWHAELIPPSRCRVSNDPADALLSIDNFARYRAQSAATRDNEVAQLPVRAPLSKELKP
jgi:hypothetical protein